MAFQNLQIQINLRKHIWFSHNIYLETKTLNSITCRNSECMNLPKMPFNHLHLPLLLFLFLLNTSILQPTPKTDSEILKIRKTNRSKETSWWSGIHALLFLFTHISSSQPTNQLVINFKQMLFSINKILSYF